MTPVQVFTNIVWFVGIFKIWLVIQLCFCVITVILLSLAVEVCETKESETTDSRAAVSTPYWVLLSGSSSLTLTVVQYVWFVLEQINHILPQGDQELLEVKDKVGRSQVSLG